MTYNEIHTINNLHDAALDVETYTHEAILESIRQQSGTSQRLIKDVLEGVIRDAQNAITEINKSWYL